MGSALKVLSISKRLLFLGLHDRSRYMFVNASEGDWFFNFVITVSKPVRMRLRFSGTLTSKFFLILKDIFMYLTYFVKVAYEPLIRR